jgi:catechol-2,3-dioxygenase
MNRLTIGHVGLHVRNIEEEVEFLELIGAELTDIDETPRGRLAFVSLDGERHHSLALFEDGEKLSSGNSKQEKQGVHHIALPTESREEVDAWKKKLLARGLEIDGPNIHAPEGGGVAAGSGSYAIFFTDPNGICFEIYAGAMTLPEYREMLAEKEAQPA